MSERDDYGSTDLEDSGVGGETKPEKPRVDDTGDLYENITISGGVVGAIGGRGHQIRQGVAAEPAAGSRPETAQGYDLAAVRDLLLAAFTAEDLRRLFLYTSNTELRPLTEEFSPADGLAAMVDRVIQFCLARALFPDLLREVEQANPDQYARFESRLRGSDSA